MMPDDVESLRLRLGTMMIYMIAIAIHSLRFEAFWTSSLSYSFPDDAERQHNPWYLHPGIETH